MRTIPSPQGCGSQGQEISMSDWQVGDLAVCVRAGRLVNNLGVVGDGTGRLQEGKTYRVIGLGALGGLIIDGVPCDRERYGWGWNPDRFRKVKPDKHEACEDEFVTLLKRGRVSA
jgi:hypothetical protein